jgi:hypothetical protein
MKRDLILSLTVGILCIILMFVGIRELMLSLNSKTEIVKNEVVKHERRKNVLHDDGKTTEVFSHTIRYGDTMTVEIDTFIYR